MRGIVDIVGVDFETYYDGDYSLTKCTTEEYIRSDKFEIIGVSKKKIDGEAQWFSGTHEEVREFLHDGLDWDKTAMFAHHAAFDGAIMSWVLGIKPGFILDTLSMARPRHLKTTGCSLSALAKHYGFGEKGQQVHNYRGLRRQDFTPAMLADYGSYCNNDITITQEFLREFMPVTSPTELRVIDHTIRMFTEPTFRLNKLILEEYLAELQEKKAKLLNAVGGNDNLHMFMSNEKFASVLQALGVDPPTKVSAKTGKTAWAFAKTDKGLKDLLEHPDPRVQAVVSCRLGVKSTIEETRTQALINVAERGLLPVMLNYWAAGTGRFSGGDGLNPQNLKRGGKIRDALEAPLGHKVLTSDLSQIEARLLAYIAGQFDLVEAFREGRDIYSEFASLVYGRTITKNDKVERFLGKTCILGLGYNTGADKLKETLRVGQGAVSVVVPREEAVRIVQLYRTQNNHITKLWEVGQRAVMSMAAGIPFTIHSGLGIRTEGTDVILPKGERLHYPSLRYDTNSETGESGYIYFDRAKPTKLYGGKLIENIIQAIARSVIAEFMVQVGEFYRLALQVHDEIVTIVPDSEVENAKATVTRIMSTAPVWLPELPIACEVGVGVSYGKAK